MSAPPPPPHNPKIERLLLQIVPWEARQEGGSLLQDCLRDLWEKAVSIGFNYGEKNLAHTREEGFSEGKEAGFKEGVESGRQTPEASEAAVHHEKALEAERVWGYDVGWKLCFEQLQSCASQTSVVPPPHPSPRSLSVAATQTDTVSVVHFIAAAPTPMPAPVPAPLPAPLDWAEDAATLPIFPLHSAPPPSTPRNFSALHTSSPQPFASLQRRRRCSPRPPTSSLQNPAPQRNSIRRPQQKFGTIRRTPLLYSRSPPSIPFPAPTSFPPSNKPAAKFPLDWDQDPCLRDLGQALAALGWVRL
ncbi:hypothetical protein B0H17DRAFT_346475 [Mycena rosella]|uniref:Uncharacterized protein n=1 Tax=Mycena rosella TaxID=1033263 RepID=A0AAD7G5S7_MYCRO|nr:hypothetical protein B0H17DRAFT_346475 [Mycena rosella]